MKYLLSFRYVATAPNSSAVQREDGVLFNGCICRILWVDHKGQGHCPIRSTHDSIRNLVGGMDSLYVRSRLCAVWGRMACVLWLFDGCEQRSLKAIRVIQGSDTRRRKREKILSKFHVGSLTSKQTFSSNVCSCKP